MAARIKISSAGMSEILQSPDVEAALIEVAEPMAATARANAPVDSGEYQAGIEVVTEVHMDRVVAHVTATAPHSMRVEARTGNLARALGG